MKSKLCLLALLCPFLSMCSSVTIRGNIINTEGAPVAGAVISITEKNKTVVSDKNGEFIIKGTKLSDSITVVAAGYKTIAEPNNERGLITIILKREIPLVRQRTVKPLSIGDTVPALEFNIINNPVLKIQLSQFKGKLIILDFWATWCNSCIKSLPKLDSLQKQSPAQLQVLLINYLPSTGNTEKQISEFISNRKHFSKALANLPVCIDTSAKLKQLFPHTFLPHYVWIGPDGTVIAITAATELTASNIRAILNGKPNPMKMKTE